LTEQAKVYPFNFDEMKLAIIGDFQKENTTHSGTNLALGQSLDSLNAGLEADWIRTDTPLGAGMAFSSLLRDYDGLLIAPGSPYASMDNVLEAIRYGREKDIPVLGTCGGFQHMVLEFARNVLHLSDADHAETNPYASTLMVTPLSCSLVGQTLEVFTRLIPGQTSLTEKYYCNFGINPVYLPALEEHGFDVVGVDAQGEARMMRLRSHTFFMGTLFVPQMSSTPQRPHPIVTAFLRAVLGMM
jgi:CTP synthase (UTP-ammonia lyase)